MSNSDSNLGAFGTLIDCAKFYVGAWVVGAFLDQALTGRNQDHCEPQVVYVPVPADPPDTAVEEMLAELEDMKRQTQELMASIEAKPVEPEPEPPKAAEPPKTQQVRRGSVEELNAALAAYNEAARRLGLVVLAGNIDKRVSQGEPEDADDAISGVISAAEQLMRLGASLANKAEELANQRKDLHELTASSRAVDEKLPVLVYLAGGIDELLDYVTEV